jgi:predicted amino acid racemase
VFLDVLIRRNPALIRAAVGLHQQGLLPANSYVLDLDAITENARMLATEGSRLGLRVYAMSKQIGRNPDALAAIRAGGIDACVAVDMTDARAVAAAGSTVGHVGHLVQVPRGEATQAAGMRPEQWTVFSTDKAREAAAAAREQAWTARLLARVHAPEDRFYSGHEGGFPVADLLAAVDALDALDGATCVGVTTFPALLFDAASRTVSPTPNLATVARAAEALRRERGGEVEVNAPGTTSVRTLATLADAGATHVEPGHALTGTTPWHAIEDLPERPAMLYLSEISHQHGGRAYCFGGGLYVDPVFEPYPMTALVGADPEEALARRVPAEVPPPSAIDYYGQLEADAATGDSVVFGFRAQAFVTRANVAAISGAATDRPTVAGVWPSAGAVA